ncbi:class I SAM-dependent methyltransferase [Spirulina sp. CS-785/01]|uniref:class I SAM-dependent methyltransferase n=1 Tax=Spirulina sp. CS-785/01 TaxID=3021716 RepID=UPI002330150F|nr:class I SAM-dependent methyltransferase [Spirulina sp. CS-785/01]MDB9314963.1 class I SAM-dependent methyltransferase [Spirulina sp. CS-785/01]
MSTFNSKDFLEFDAEIPEDGGSSGQKSSSCPICQQSPVIPFLSVGGRDYWRCCHCQGTFLAAEQLPTAREERDCYDLHENDGADGGYRRFLNRLLEPLLGRLQGRQEGLDYGCGPNPVLAQMVRDAEHSMAVYDPFFYCDRTPLQRQYDFITCTEVVEHFYHPAQEFALLSRLLKTGGWLAIMTCFQTDDAAFANWHYRREFTHVTFYREFTFQILAQQWGFHWEIPRRNVVLLQKIQ